MFESIPAYPGDPILSLFQTFQADPQPQKVNLSIGLYYDDTGTIPILGSAREAGKRVYDQGDAHTYLPMEGMASYRMALQRLIFGDDCSALREKRIATIQSVGGSGALRIGAELLKRYFPDSAIWLSDPTWDNHRVLFAGAGIDVCSYPYYDPQTNEVRFDEMLTTFDTLPPRSIVLLQPCCHNPTGIDLTRAHWQEVIARLTERNLIPFLDIAYQGFGNGLADDVWVARAMVDAGLSFFVSHSFSKNFSLYGERCGGLSVVCASKREAATVLSQLQAGVRRLYSSPPLFGAQLISTVLNDVELIAQWESEVAAMRARIKLVRSGLRQKLQNALPCMSFDYLVNQSGMFSYTGITPAEVDALRVHKGVYLLRSGRMCMAGINDTNLEYVAQSISGVLKARTRK